MITDRLSNLSNKFYGSPIDSSTAELEKYPEGSIISFAMGSPSQENIPWRLIHEATNLAKSTPGTYDYAPTEGYTKLLDTLAEAEFLHDGEVVESKNLMTTVGATQGLDLLFKMFVNPNDTVIVEAPTYTNGPLIALSYGAELHEVGVDEDGMDVDALEAFLETNEAKIIYTVPTFQNPSGVTMSREKRLKLIDLARKHNVLIIDDDPYRLLRYEGEQIPSLRSLTVDNDHIVSVRTFSKVIAPAYRLGWLEMSEELREVAVRARQGMDTCSSTFIQNIIERVISQKGFQSHVKEMNVSYRWRRDVMKECLAEEFGDEISMTSPEGGFFLWVTFKEEVNTTELLGHAMGEGVAFVPGEAFSQTKLGSERLKGGLRLCFASNPEEKIREGVLRLKRAYERLKETTTRGVASTRDVTTTTHVVEDRDEQPRSASEVRIANIAPLYRK